MSFLLGAEQPVDSVAETLVRPLRPVKLIVRSSLRLIVLLDIYASVYVISVYITYLRSV